MMKVKAFSFLPCDSRVMCGCDGQLFMSQEIQEAFTARETDVQRIWWNLVILIVFMITMSNWADDLTFGQFSTYLQFSCVERTTTLQSPSRSPVFRMIRHTARAQDGEKNNEKDRQKYIAHTFSTLAVVGHLVSAQVRRLHDPRGRLG